MTEASIPPEIIKNIKTSMNEIRTRRRANTPAVESFIDEWQEEWRPIPEFPEYEVSDFGNVRSWRTRGSKKGVTRPRVLKVNRARYPSVSLPRPGGSYSNQMVHRLVMLTFIGPCPEGREVAHLNGNRQDNRLVNLAYVTHEENEAHKVEHGTTGRGENNSIAILQGWQVEEIKYLANAGVALHKIAALFDIGRGHVRDICEGRIWTQTPARTSLPAAVAALKAVLEEEGPRATGYYSEYSVGYHDALDACREAIEAALEWYE